jgi:hypothetical protein
MRYHPHTIQRERSTKVCGTPPGSENSISLTSCPGRKGEGCETPPTSRSAISLTFYEKDLDEWDISSHDITHRLSEKRRRKTHETPPASKKAMALTS